MITQSIEEVAEGMREDPEGWAEIYMDTKSALEQAVLELLQITDRLPRIGHTEKLDS